MKQRRKNKTMTLQTSVVKSLLRDRAAAKAERDLLLDAFGPFGSPLAKSTVQNVASTLAVLYQAAHPTTGAPPDDEGKPPRTNGIHRMPGEGTRREYARWKRGVYRLEKWVEEFAGEEPDRASRPDRPKCTSCNRRGGIGDRFCGRCGGSFEKENAA